MRLVRFIIVWINAARRQKECCNFVQPSSSEVQIILYITFFKTNFEALIFFAEKSVRLRPRRQI